MRKKFTDEWMDGGWYTKNRNLVAESYPRCYGIAGVKASLKQADCFM